MRKNASSLIGTFVLAGLAVCGNSSALSAPLVSKVVQDGTALNISGSGFGAGKVTPLLWDDFEAGTNGSPIAAAPRAGTWETVNSTQTIYTTAQKHSGSKSLYAYRTASSQWANFNVNMPDRRYFYKSFWFRHNFADGATGQSKLSQIHGTYNVGDYNPGIMSGGLSGDWWASYLALENTGMYRRANYFAMPSKNAWHHFESVLKQSDANVANGSVTIKIDGKVVYRQQDVKTRERSGERWNLATFFTGQTNFGSKTETWLDDVYLNDSWARVELCESPTYTACTRKEIQPLSSWGANAISVTLNKGVFAAGQTAYVYVVNASGVANPSGYPVVIAN